MCDIDSRGRDMNATSLAMPPPGLSMDYGETMVQSYRILYLHSISYIRPTEGITKQPVFCNNSATFDPDAIMVSMNI